MLFRSSALLLLAALLGGCASPLRISLPAEQRAAIKEVDTRLVVIQDEVIVDVKPSTSAAAGVGFARSAKGGNDNLGGSAS